MAEDVLDNQQRPEANYGRKLFKDIPEEQVIQQVILILEA